MIKAIVVGAAGRMGSRITALIQETPSIQLTGAVETAGHPQLGMDAGQVAGIKKLNVPITDQLASVIDQGQVIVDFTTPESTLAHLELIAQRRKPVVIGTTGLGPDGLDQIRKTADKTACVLSPNMSIAVNVMFKIVAEVATLLGQGYDIEIVEAHHRFKKDAPSGTALRLAEILARARDKKLEQVATYGRRGQVGERKNSEIGIQAVRAGDIVGDHTVLFAGLGERLEITHRAHSRDNFARGAIIAAQWIVKQPPGLYDMADVLGISH